MRILRSIKSLFQFQMVVVMLLVAPASWAQTQEQPGPQEVVSHLQETLIKSMREGGNWVTGAGLNCWLRQLTRLTISTLLRAQHLVPIGHS